VLLLCNFVKVKVELSLCFFLTKHHATKAYWEGGGIAPLNCLTSALGGDEWSASYPDHSAPKERAPGTHWIGFWVGPRAVLDMVVKRKIPNPDHPACSLVTILLLLLLLLLHYTFCDFVSVTKYVRNLSLCKKRNIRVLSYSVYSKEITRFEQNLKTH